MVIGLSTPRPAVTAGVALLLVGVTAAAYVVTRSQLSQPAAGASSAALEVTPSPTGADATSAAPDPTSAAPGPTSAAPVTAAAPVAAPVVPSVVPVTVATAPRVLQLTGAGPAEFGIVRGAIVLSAPDRAPAGAHEVLTLSGPRRMSLIDAAAPYRWSLNTLDLPNGLYLVSVSTTGGTAGTPAPVRTARMTVANAGAAATGRRPTPTHSGPTGSDPTRTTPAPAPARTTPAPAPIRAASGARSGTASGARSDVTSGPGTGDDRTGAIGSAAAQTEVLVLTNQARTANGCRPLTVNNVLTAVAEAHSKDMAEHDYFSHESQDGTTPFARMTTAGYRYSVAAENIAAGQRTPGDVVTAWMNSPGHRANILNCALKEIGVGYVTGGSYGSYWTQDFGTPL